MNQAPVSPHTVRQLLRNRGIRPRKKLGQSFLVDPNVTRKIVRFLSPCERDVFLEIGAGIGALTLPLAQSGGRVFAVEVDAKLMPLLESVVADFHNVELIEEDILRVNIPELLSSAGTPQLTAIGNLPYSITTQIVLYLIRNRQYIDRALITVQREYAERLLARPGSRDYGSITVLAQFHCTISQSMTISSSCFFPEPGVSSTVLDLRLRGKPAVPVKDESVFERAVRAAFSHRRKMLLNSLAESMELDKAETAQLLEKAEVEGALRAEQLGLEELGRIADVFYDEGLFTGSSAGFTWSDSEEDDGAQD
jgi:16S rRNA (adenine1518-N6/adenine1519-N6)-dimethyltransferase